MEEATQFPPSLLSQKNNRLPDDTVFFSIFPDFSLPSSNPNLAPTELSSQLQSLHLQILHSLSPHTSNYIWQHEPFTLSIFSTSTSTSTGSCFCCAAIPHLHGKLRFGDNLEDEWFVVFLLFETSRNFPNLSIRVWDTDGEFLLIEAAFHLPRWVNPETSTNRVFIRGGELHIVPNIDIPSTPSLSASLSYLRKSGDKSRASDSVQLAIRNRIRDYPEQARKNMHRVRVRVPVAVAQVLKHEPCLISLAVEGFYDRDIDSMKFAAKMERFLPAGSGEELVPMLVTMSRAMYAQLMQQTFQAPKCYPMLQKNDVGAFVEAELGMKIACGFEMMYQMRKSEGLVGRGSTWEAFRESLDRSEYFQGLLPGSKEYQRLMENAKQYYRNSSLHSRVSETMSAPVRRIDEILAVPHLGDDMKEPELPPSDDDAWLYNGEDELNAALQDRQNEVELYNLKHKKKQKSKEMQGSWNSSGSNTDDLGLGNIAKSMQAFVHKMSSYEGAEVPENRNIEAVNFDVDRFVKDMESVIGRQGFDVSGSDVDIGEGSSSDMDFDESEDGSDVGDPSGDIEEEEDTFMHSYSNSLSDELKCTTLNRSFIRANEQSLNKDMGTSNASADMNEEFTPVDVDVNLVKSLLDSFTSQQGLPGPSSNLLGLMGLQLPKGSDKDK